MEQRAQLSVLRIQQFSKSREHAKGWSVLTVMVPQLTIHKDLLNEILTKTSDTARATHFLEIRPETQR